MLDLSAAFDTLDHRVLLNRMSNLCGVDGIPLQWFRSYLSDRTQQVHIAGVTSNPSQLNIGVPQGSVLGPVLFNIYTSPLYNICMSHELSPHFYADDSQLYIVCALDDISHSFDIMNTCIDDIKCWMVSNKLKLNGDKTELTVFASPIMYKRVLEFPTLNVTGNDVNHQHQCRNLGAHMDSSLSYDSHVQNICKLSYMNLNQFYSIRKSLDRASAETIIHAFITSRLDYCNSLLFGLSMQNIKKLQRVQNCAARLCLKIPRRARISSKSLLQRLHWLAIASRIKFKILLFTYKALNGLAPNYLSELLHVRDIPRELRSSDDKLLVVPKSRTVTFGDRAFSCAAPRLWNGLPKHIRSANSLSSFKSLLKTHLFDSA